MKLIRLGINRQYPTGYRALRNQLTLVVLVSHVCMYWLINGSS